MNSLPTEKCYRDAITHLWSSQRLRRRGTMMHLWTLGTTAVATAVICRDV